jgi:hypothetical protein
MYTIKKNSAKQVTIFALIFWLSSLFFTGLELYGLRREISGLEILLSGWLSPLDGNFAWFANIFFIICALLLLLGAAPKISPILCVILALDTFRYSMLTVNEGGHSQPIYGYGWGAIIWLISMCVIFIAAGLRLYEINLATERRIFYKIYLFVGVFLLLATSSITFYNTYNDRSLANKSELKRLQNIAFKRGEVCSVEGPFVYQPLKNFAGTLEVVADKKLLQAAFPFSKIEELLSWGIPKIRVGSVDYSYSGGNQVEEIIFSQEYKKPEATLYVDEAYLQSIRIVLVENRKNRVVFDQVWKWEDHKMNTRYFCPEYFSNPTSEQQPRKLIMQALGLYSETNKF